MEWLQEFQPALDKIHCLFEESSRGRTKCGVVAGELGPRSSVVAVGIPFADKLLIGLVGLLNLGIKFHHIVLFTSQIIKEILLYGDKFLDEL